MSFAPFTVQPMRWHNDGTGKCTTVPDETQPLREISINVDEVQVIAVSDAGTRITFKNGKVLVVVETIQAVRERLNFYQEMAAGWRRNPGLTRL